MNTASRYRQSVADFRQRLDTLGIETDQRGRRVLIDSTGNRTRFTPGSDPYGRMVVYGRRRYLSVCRVYALLQAMRELEGVSANAAVTHTGAYWQSVRGTADQPACHTCPALLLIDNQLPTLQTTNMGLRRHLIAVFADCMLMPKWINDIDGEIDSIQGRDAFARIAGFVLQHDNVSWSEAARVFREMMRDVLNEARDLGHVEDQRISAIQGFYEGIFLTSATSEIGNFLTEVNAEVNQGLNLAG